MLVWLCARVLSNVVSETAHTINNRTSYLIICHNTCREPVIYRVWLLLINHSPTNEHAIISSCKFLILILSENRILSFFFLCFQLKPTFFAEYLNSSSCDFNHNSSYNRRNKQTKSDFSVNQMDKFCGSEFWVIFLWSNTFGFAFATKLISRSILTLLRITKWF